MKIDLREIRSDYEGFAQLIELAHRMSNLEFDSVSIDMGAVSWFDANMSAPFGAFLYKVSRNLNTVKLLNIPPRVEAILSKNAFLSSYGRAKRPDTYGTTIEYKRFEPKDDRYFAAYVERHLVGKGMPQMTARLLKKFRESIYEIFSNAVIHSETKLGIFACGQYFPNKNRLDFSIADLGIGIRQNVNKKRGLDLSAEQAISWAMASNNTTKSGSIPGGLGLKLLREFITLNRGRLQIVSDRGYWVLAHGQVTTKAFPHRFPGTVVNIEINTADKGLYRLSSETATKDIF